MNYDEEKEIKVTFPEEYQAKDLAGAEVVFKVKLHEIKEKVLPELDDAFAKEMLPQEENATIEVLKEKVKEQIETEKRNKLYTEELQPAYLAILVEKIDFAVPASILDQEINNALNAKAREMSEDELKELQENQDKLKELSDEVTPEATNSVKATFIVDALAKAEGVEVSDQEVTQTLYYEAMMMGQDGQALIKQYEEAGYLPAIKMSMIEQKTISKLLDEKVSK
jgi:trigger factor